MLGPLNPYAAAVLEYIPLPDRLGVYNGVTSRCLPWYMLNDHQPDAKKELTNAVLDAIEPGDTAVFVGGGRGIVPINAARAGADVVVYEAAAEYVAKLREAAVLNDVRITVYHAIVGEAVEVYGSTGGCEHVHPKDLAGDVLVLDCEGAETSILPHVDGFRNLVVESHPKQGATTDWVLDAVGGRIVAPDPADGDIVVV